MCVCQTRADLGRDCYGTVVLASCLGFVPFGVSLSSCFWSVKRQFDAFAVDTLSLSHNTQQTSILHQNSQEWGMTVVCACDGV